jgi:hypothetical protein
MEATVGPFTLSQAAAASGRSVEEGNAIGRGVRLTVVACLVISEKSDAIAKANGQDARLRFDQAGVASDPDSRDREIATPERAR